MSVARDSSTSDFDTKLTYSALDVSSNPSSLSPAWTGTNAMMTTMKSWKSSRSCHNFALLVDLLIGNRDRTDNDDVDDDNTKHHSDISSSRPQSNLATERRRRGKKETRRDFFSLGFAKKLDSPPPHGRGLQTP